MTTQVQIGQGRSHLTYLKIIASQFASGAGMARRDTEDVVRAITDVCQHSSKSPSFGSSQLIVSLSISGACMIAEMRGFPTNFEASKGDAPQGLESLCRFVDTVEIFREEGGDMVRLTKYVNRPTNPAVVPVPGLSKLSGSILHN